MSVKLGKWETDRPTARYAEEDPDIDHEAEAEHHSDVHEHDRTEAGGLVRCGVVGGVRSRIGHLRAGEGEEQEHRGTNELAKCRNEVYQR